MSDESDSKGTAVTQAQVDEEEEDEDDVEKAFKKEIAAIKQVPSVQQRFQNCITKAKNCVFIRSTVEDIVKVGHSIMTDLAEKCIQRARYAARILPVVGTCKAHTPDIKQLALKCLANIFSPDSSTVPDSFTVIFKSRNNNGTTCGKLTVIPAVVDAVKEINPNIIFSWNDYKIAILVEIVCTVCCLCVAPEFLRLRKYNLQELKQGPRELSTSDKVLIQGDDQSENASIETCASVHDRSEDNCSQNVPSEFEKDHDHDTKEWDKECNANASHDGQKIIPSNKQDNEIISSEQATNANGTIEK